MASNVREIKANVRLRRTRMSGNDFPAVIEADTAGRERILELYVSIEDLGRLVTGSTVDGRVCLFTQDAEVERLRAVLTDIDGTLARAHDDSVLLRCVVYTVREEIKAALQPPAPRQGDVMPPSSNCQG